MTGDSAQTAQPVPASTRKAVLISASRFHGHRYSENHPLSIPRVSLTLDLIRSYGALREGEFLTARCATDAELEWFHTRAYISAMRRCETREKVYDRHRWRHNIGTFENPYFPNFFTVPATATGGSVQGAEQVLSGCIAFNPAGGMHHALPDQARGFCFFNDAVLAILRLRREGLRVLYLDIDAHHGDGVEYAFCDDAQVLTFSLHMDTRYAYPFHGGGLGDWGALGNALNVPLPERTNDSEYRRVFSALWPAVLERFRPDVIVLQAGTDMLFMDPLGKLNVSTQFFLEVVERVVCDCPVHADGTPFLLVVGGGGYHPLSLARCWLGVWGVLSGRQLPEAIPLQGQALLHAVGWDMDEDAGHFQRLFVSRLDEPHEGEARPQIDGAICYLLDNHPLFQGLGHRG